MTRLEARLQELENPETTTPSVTLHDPYNHFRDTQRPSKSPPLFIPETIPFGPLSPFSPTSTSSSLPSGRHWNTFSALEAMTESTGSSGSSTSPTRRFASSPFLGAEVSYASCFSSEHVLILHSKEPSFLLIQNL